MTIELYTLKVSKHLFKNFCYLLVDTETRQAIAIDPAWQIEKIDEVLQKTDSQLVAILVTHHHLDHVDLADTLARKYNCLVYFSAKEAMFYDFFCYNLQLIPGDKPFSIGNIQVTPLATPGHTKESLCYWIGNYLFTGDTLFIEGCGACLDKGADAVELFHTFQKFRSLLPMHTEIYPGHSFGQPPGITLSEVIKCNIYFHFRTAEEFVTYRMRPSQKNILNFH